jgi:5-methylcytosine-specific restriction endonuclease McrA
MAHPASIAFYQSAAWRALRAACLSRDEFRCAAPGCTARATHADHIITRPRSPTPTAADHIGNLRSLCPHHDAQVKEQTNGQRRSGGHLTTKGADTDGWPIDPRRR